jgi:hypothetical protein
VKSNENTIRKLPKGSRKTNSATCSAIVREARDRNSQKGVERAVLYSNEAILTYVFKLETPKRE